MEEKFSLLERIAEKERETKYSKRLTSLFAAAMFIVATGCSDDEADCVDKNQDHYCDKETCEDDDQDGVCDEGNGRTGGAYYYKNGKKVYKKISGISSGSKKGGIGSYSRSGGG
ncbi:hypothetical protein [Marininema halotolerans]|uniref:Uncharacterized protein n=1 Tax=Marininema halotolerans TaxID=1155944 RepID=A0A1I6NZ76_9BACL|nr:hypothetical protein [Marininema halotolerans]SFS33128.1 hypothetical protein SAMN05444972_101244 [Marininema halotolerans]